MRTALARTPRKIFVLHHAILLRIIVVETVYASAMGIVASVVSDKVCWSEMLVMVFYYERITGKCATLS